MNGSTAVQTHVTTKPVITPIASGVLQRAAINSSPVHDVPPIVHEVLHSSGQPLDAATRTFMGTSFGHDFSEVPVRNHTVQRSSSSNLSIGPVNDKYEDEANWHANRITSPGLQAASIGSPGIDFSGVRVHTDNKAAESARAMSALAYTVGRDVVFGAGEYAPGTTEGRRLLAHELTHVLQQRDQTRLQRKNNKEKPKPTEPKQEETPEATSPSAGASKAIAHAQKQKGQTAPAIWFDSWGNDLRDNNLNGKVDDKTEQGLSDGTHYGKDFDAMICKTPSDTTDKCPPKDQSKIKVNYKVCIDIPIEAYKAAGASIPTTRWIPTFFGQLRKNPDWTVWKKPARPSHFLEGDIVAAANAAHQHAGIVEKGFLGIDWVINLPGPTAARKYGVFTPSGKNDMVSVPGTLFESFLGIDWIARPKK
jgi:hypothetical protein